MVFTRASKPSKAYKLRRTEQAMHAKLHRSRQSKQAPERKAKQCKAVEKRIKIKSGKQTRGPSKLKFLSKVEMADSQSKANQSKASVQATI